VAVLTGITNCGRNMVSGSIGILMSYLIAMENGAPEVWAESTNVSISLRVVSQQWKHFVPETFHLFIEVWAHGHEVHAVEPQLDEAA
jgi:hypothetical protein